MQSEIVDCLVWIIIILLSPLSFLDLSLSLPPFLSYSSLSPLSPSLLYLSLTHFPLHLSPSLSRELMLSLLIWYVILWNLSHLRKLLYVLMILIFIHSSSQLILTLSHQLMLSLMLKRAELMLTISGTLLWVNACISSIVMFIKFYCSTSLTCTEYVHGSTSWITDPHWIWKIIVIIVLAPLINVIP